MNAPQEIVERPLQLRGSRVARALLRLAGWKLLFDGLPAAQGVAVVYPHTSNWDFVVLVLAKWSVGLPASFWGKDTLFRIPLFGRWLRWIGGIPVLRNAPQGVVGQAIEALQQARQQGRILWLGLSPEGTRKPTAGWRSGFYQTALGAQVPLGLVRLDYGLKEVRVMDFVTLTGDKAQDMAQIRQAYAGVVAYRPDWMAPIDLNSQNKKA